MSSDTNQTSEKCGLMMVEVGVVLQVPGLITVQHSN